MNSEFADVEFEEALDKFVAEYVKTHSVSREDRSFVFQNKVFWLGVDLVRNPEAS